MRLLSIIFVLILLTSSAQAQLLGGSRSGPSAIASYVVNGQLSLFQPPLLVTTHVGGAFNINKQLGINAVPALTAAGPNIAPPSSLLPLSGNSLLLSNVTLNGSFNAAGALTNSTPPSLTSTHSANFSEALSLRLPAAPLIAVTSIGTSKKISTSLGLLGVSLTGSAALSTGSTVFTSRLGVVNGQNAENSMYGVIQPGIQ